MCPGDQTRRRVACALLLSLAGGLSWWFSPGVPVLRGPHASRRAKETGRGLFEREWAPNDPLARGDGLGPVFNSSSCVGCHFQGGMGGSGTARQNVVTFEALPIKTRPRIQGGLVHAHAVTASLGETHEIVRRLFPVIPGGLRVIEGCSVRVEDLDPVRFESINSTALFGAGWLDRMPVKAITHGQMRKLVAGTFQDFQLDFKAIPPGRARDLPGGRVGKFGWKAQFASLDEFVAAACANELGLGNPLMDQARPLGGDGHPAAGKRDLSRKQFRSLVAFVATLPRPVRALPEDPYELGHSMRGEGLFASVGCAFCHTPDLGGVKGLYSDLLLHTVEDRSKAAGYTVQEALEVPLPNDHPRPGEWKTPPLWGVADSAPYFHDGGSGTLEDAIRRHAADAATVTQAYSLLPAQDQAAIVAFLKTLRAPSNALPAAAPPERVAQR